MLYASRCNRIYSSVLKHTHTHTHAMNTHKGTFFYILCKATILSLKAVRREFLWQNELLKLSLIILNVSHCLQPFHAMLNHLCPSQDFGECIRCCPFFFIKSWALKSDAWRWLLTEVSRCPSPIPRWTLTAKDVICVSLHGFNNPKNCKLSDLQSASSRQILNRQLYIMWSSINCIA